MKCKPIGAADLPPYKVLFLTPPSTHQRQYDYGIALLRRIAGLLLGERMGPAAVILFLRVSIRALCSAAECRLNTGGMGLPWVVNVCRRSI